MKKILILNGPNLNMIGTREPEIYGHQTLHDIEELCLKKAKALSFEVDFRQSNYEGEIVTWIQEEREALSGVIINAAAYTHTSVAIHDALRLLSCPIVEVHLSNPKEREEFRHFSYIESLAVAVIAGHGASGYEMALEELAKVLR
ncbi:MAG: type II 3-dehydroquinate dehydratase [Zetaproteobacteria bacterium]|nr:MAG: type II 3-dehydroquinate dehydratase [Zetaproteobacteria bacterium]